MFFKVFFIELAIKFSYAIGICLFANRNFGLMDLQVSERDDKLLAEHMAKLRTANEEVDGDAGSEEEEDTGMGELDVENSGVGMDD